MTDLAQGQVTRPGGAKKDRPGRQEGRGEPGNRDSGRAAARAVLDAALSGVDLSSTDRRFLARFSQWDKRTATTLASLVARARLRGRREAALTPSQLDVVLAALIDGFEYRTSGAASAGCWDCTSMASGLCAEHGRDADRAREFADLAISLAETGGGLEASPVRPEPSPLALPELSLCGERRLVRGPR